MKKFVKDTSKKLATGALAILATIGGSSFGVFAGPNTPTGSIKVPPTAETANTWTTADELDLGANGTGAGSIPVKGYQTSKVYNYEIQVSWGDMKFIFDRGQYNPNTNRLTKKVRTDAWRYCEGGAYSAQNAYQMDGTPVSTSIPTDESAIYDDGGVGYWCGFDGTNNRVDVVNLGNGNINMVASCTEGVTGQTLGSAVDMQVGVITTEAEPSVSSSYDNWTIGGTPTTYNLPDGESQNPVQMTFATGNNAAASAVIQKAFPLNTEATEPSQSHANVVRFYLNITGTPDAGDNASYLDTLTQTPSADGGWDQIGSINLAFNGLGENNTPSIPTV